jgi:hypothetical protein
LEHPSGLAGRRVAIRELSEPRDGNRTLSPGPLSPSSGNCLLLTYVNENRGLGLYYLSMDGRLVVLLVVVAAVGVLIYCQASQRRPQPSPVLQQAFHTTLNHFADLARKGLQIKLMAGEPPNIALRSAEHLLCVFPKTTLLEPRAVREWRSRCGGSSIRIAKGLSLRLGGSRGVSESHDEFRAIDTGTLLLTNERLNFIGSQRTNSIPLKTVVDIEGYSNALVCGSHLPQCPVQFDSPPILPASIVEPLHMAPRRS